MEAHEKISEIRARMERYRDGDKDSAVTLIRFDLPYLIKLVYDLSHSMDATCQENSRLRSELHVYKNDPLKVVFIQEAEFENIINTEDEHGRSEIDAEALAQGAAAPTP